MNKQFGLVRAWNRDKTNVVYFYVSEKTGNVVSPPFDSEEMARGWLEMNMDLVYRYDEEAKVENSGTKAST